MAVPRVLRLGIVIVGAALLSTPVAVASPDDGICVGPRPTFDVAAERSLRTMTNVYRVQHGLRPLRAAGRLTRVARNHSLAMARADSFAHSGSSGRFPWAGSRAAAENLALGGTAEVVMDLLKNSTTHRDILLASSYRRFGIGVLVTCTGYLLVTEDFTS